MSRTEKDGGHKSPRQLRSTERLEAELRHNGTSNETPVAPAQSPEDLAEEIPPVLGRLASGITPRRRSLQLDTGEDQLDIPATDDRTAITTHSTVSLDPGTLRKIGMHIGDRSIDEIESLNERERNSRKR